MDGKGLVVPLARFVSLAVWVVLGGVTPSPVVGCASHVVLRHRPFGSVPGTLGTATSVVCTRRFEDQAMIRHGQVSNHFLNAAISVQHSAQ